MPLLKKSIQPMTPQQTDIISGLMQAVTDVTPPIDHKYKKQTKDEPMTRADWDAKDRRISRAGLYQAALQSVGVVQYGGKSFDDYLARVREAAEAGLSFITEGV